MKKPAAFMKNLDVSFVSLVDKGANKQKFEIFKAEDGKATVDKNANKGPVATKKYYGDCAPCYNMGSSFSGAIQAINTQEKLVQSQCDLDEAFWVLKTVMQGVLEDDNIKAKGEGLKKAISEFQDYAVSLFDGLPVAKAQELLNPTGGDMDPKTKAELEKGKQATTQKEGGVSQNGEPAADNRRGDDTSVAGISKKKYGMKKKMLEEQLEVVKGKMKDCQKEGWPKDKMKKAELEAHLDEAAALEEELEALEKAVGDRSEGAPATGLDTVSGNGEAATAGQANNGATGDTAGNVAKSDKAPVEKDVAGIETPTMSSAQTQNVKHDVSLAGQIGPIVEEFKKTMEVALDGKIGGMTDLLKGLETKVKGLEEKVNKTETTVAKAASMGGLSNSLETDFEESVEAKAKREEVAKSESDVWKGATDGFGGLKGLKK